MSKMALAYNMKKRMKKECHGGDMMASGGAVKGVHESITRGDAGTSNAGAHIGGHGYGNNVNTAKRIHKEKLSELRAMPKPNLPMAEGGEIMEPMHGEQHGDKELDMVGRIMKHREHMYSKGGEVANDDQPMADAMPNDFDDLALHDGLEFHDTGANSGDELGDEAEDHDRKDIVSKIMKSRAKKDRNPRPA